MKIIAPIEISDVDFAFPARALEWMPALDEIPVEFREGLTLWNKAADRIFYGSMEGIELEPKEGIDPYKAGRHIMAIMRSYAPKHEHKIAACAYLMSRFFGCVNIADPQ